MFCFVLVVGFLFFFFPVVCLYRNIVVEQVLDRENAKKNQKGDLKTGKQASPWKISDVQLGSFMTERLNESIGHSCKFLQRIRILMVLNQRHNSIEWIGNKLKVRLSQVQTS